MLFQPFEEDFYLPAVSIDVSYFLNCKVEIIVYDNDWFSFGIYCYVLINPNGYYEWEKIGKEKLPSRITLPKSEVFAFAGIWEYWERGEIQLYTCSIITTEASASVKHLHHRMPVILKEDMQEVWLRGNYKDRLKSLLTSYSGEINAYRVFQKVNSAANDEPACIEPIH